MVEVDSFTEIILNILVTQCSLEKETLAKVTEIAVAMEAADKHSKAIEAKSNETVNILQKPTI